MRVYRITSDEDYQYFLTEDEHRSLDLWMDCTPRRATWDPPPVFIYKPLLKRGDFFNFGGDKLILSPRAAELLRWHLEDAGELLPVPFEGETYTLLNVTECINCLDTARTEFRVRNSTRIFPPLLYVFHPDRFPESDIFKIPETHKAEVLVVERDPEDGFLADLKRFGIQGYKLTLLWDSETPTP